MRIRFCLLVVGGAVAASALSGQQQDALKQAHASRLAALKDAYAKQDVKFFESVVAPSYTSVSVAGKKAGRAQALAALRAFFGKMRSVAVEFRVRDVKVEGSRLVATTVRYARCTLKPDAKGKTHLLEMNTFLQETWSKIGTKWVLTRLEEMRAGHHLMDGKKVDPTKAGFVGSPLLG
jgi:hypothetical protein